MKLDDFLTSASILTTEELTGSAESTNAVNLECAILGASQFRLRIEYQGTVYEVDKSDVQDVTQSSAGVVTASGQGTPARVSLKADADLISINRIRAESLVGQRPFVLARPTHANDVSFALATDDRDTQWLRARGLMREPLANTRTMSTLWCESRSPSTSQPRLDNWVGDDSQSDGQHPDD